MIHKLAQLALGLAAVLSAVGLVAGECRAQQPCGLVMHVGFNSSRQNFEVLLSNVGDQPVPITDFSIDVFDDASNLRCRFHRSLVRRLRIPVGFNRLSRFSALPGGG